jgi:histidine triad (HIT) family protein/ATP adenylyltransferase
VAGEHDSELEQVIAEDEENFAFLSRYPTLVGYVLVAPKAHREHVVRDLTEDAYLRLMSLVYRVARAVEVVVPTERIYLMSLGSQQGNAHLHWHVPPLPPGVPYRDQQFHALTTRTGLCRGPWSRQSSSTPVCGRGVLLGRHRLSEQWLPPGGHVDPGEHPLAAARVKYMRRWASKPTSASSAPTRCS